MDDAELGRWPVSLDIPVAWGEMDAFGHVNNTVYLRWCESARIAYFDRLGVIERMKSDGVGPILARAAVDYRKPVVYPATVRAHATISRLGQSSFTMLYRLELATSGERVADGESVVVLVDYRTGAKVPLDDVFRARIRAFEATGERP